MGTYSVLPNEYEAAAEDPNDPMFIQHHKIMQTFSSNKHFIC